MKKMFGKLNAKKWLITVMIIGVCILVSPMVFLLLYRVSCELPSFGDDVTKTQAIEIAYNEASEMETQGVLFFDKSAIPEPLVWLSNDHYQISYHDHQRQHSLTVSVFLNGCVEKSFNHEE